ncbi:MAG: RDD family protein [Spirochaetales bacterium]|nr:RDD family protein [Spirochaetales bacterium]
MESENNLQENRNDSRVPATLLQRFTALLIDRLLCLLFLLCVSYFNRSDLPFFFKIIKLCEQTVPTAVIYHIIFELCWNGLTPGKKICRIRVVRENYEHLSISAVATRNFLRFTDALPIFYLTGAISFFNTQKKQRIGDISAETLVVCEESINDSAAENKIFSSSNTQLSSDFTEYYYNQKDKS